MRAAPLADVCEIVMGQAPKGNTYNTAGVGLPLIAGAGDFGDLHPAVTKYTTADRVRTCRAGDIVLSIRASIGTKVLADGEYCLGRGVAGLRARSHLDDRYLWHWTTAAAPELTAKGRGATFLQVNKADISKLEIPLPPIEEQRRIAAVLDAADALRANRREALTKLETLTQAIFIDMFGRPDHTFGLAPIGDLVAPGKNTIRTGPFGSQLLHEEFTNEGMAVLGIDNAVNNRFVWGKRRFISAEKYEQLKRFTVRPGDLLVTIMATTGRVAVVPDDIPTAINTKHLCCITLDRAKCLPWYLWAALRFDPSVRRQLGATHGAVMPGLNMGKIKQAQVLVPPLRLQEQFMQRLNAVEQLSQTSAASHDELNLLFSSLQQRAFRGEL